MEIMQRKREDISSPKTMRNLQYLPLIPFKIKNWQPFLWNFLGFTHTTPVYEMWNGLSIATDRSDDVMDIVDIFMRKKYGDAADHSIIIDIGAGIGAYSLFATTVSKNATIYAFETNPRDSALLKENIEENRLQDEILSFNRAVTCKNEKTILVGANPQDPPGTGEKPSGAEVDCTSLDEIFEENKLKRCDMLKIESENAELDILNSASPETLAKISRIRMTYNYSPDCTDAAADLLKFFEGREYTIVKHVPSNPTSGLIWAERKKIE